MYHWQPTASIENLKKRAEILSKIRQFFAKRDVLEVETPALSQASVTDPFIQSIKATCESVCGSRCASLFLQTSPEYGMKRLLAAGSGSIYQICKSFRNGESGRHHNPEFTMLEWYRIGFDHHDLMNEMDELFQFVLGCKPAEKISYAELFQKHLQIDPHKSSAIQLESCARASGVAEVSGIDSNDKDVWLQILMSDYIEPRFGKDPVFIYDYPASQAALSRIRQDDPPVAERFEAYINGIELANGFHELANAKEQRERFEKNCVKRQSLNYPGIPIDEYFLSALEAGLPDCSGIAVGIDRLVMAGLGVDSIQDVITFPVDIA